MNKGALCVFKGVIQPCLNGVEWACIGLALFI